MPRRGRGPATPAETVLDRLWRRVDDAVAGVVGTVTFDELRREAGHRDPVDFTI
jgi:hypothetical protein